MSEETAKRIAEAKAQEAEQQKIVDALTQDCLNEVAAGIPVGAEKYAKSISHAQPEITKGLGRDGVSALREEISAAAVELATEIKEAATAIKWPESGSRKDDVATALFKFLYGSRIGRFDAMSRVGAELPLTEPKTDRSRRRVPLHAGVVTQLRAHRTRQLQERL